MKKVLLQELMYVTIVLKLITAFLKVLDPIETCILDFRKKTSINSASLDFGHERTRAF
jgi:hypothetical protein